MFLTDKKYRIFQAGIRIAADGHIKDDRKITEADIGNMRKQTAVFLVINQFERNSPVQLPVIRKILRADRQIAGILKIQPVNILCNVRYCPALFILSVILVQIDGGCHIDTVLPDNQPI